jgi:hypothetical protein
MSRGPNVCKLLQVGVHYTKRQKSYGIPVDTVPWIKEIRDRFLEIWNAATEPTPESAVLITNFAF